MIIMPFQPEHLKQIELQSEQTLAKKHLENEDYARQLAGYESWTGFIDDKVVACAGLIPVWGDRWQAWSIISATIGPSGMLQLTRAIMRGMRIKTGRIEAVVAAEFKEGHRWAELLGFTLETPLPMRKWFPEGGDAYLYSRIK